MEYVAFYLAGLNGATDRLLLCHKLWRGFAVLLEACVPSKVFSSLAESF